LGYKSRIFEEYHQKNVIEFILKGKRMEEKKLPFQI